MPIRDGGFPRYRGRSLYATLGAVLCGLGLGVAPIIVPFAVKLLLCSHHPGARATPPVPPRCIAAVVRRLGHMVLEFPAHPQAGGDVDILPGETDLIPLDN